MSHDRIPVLILGAGLQGCSIALELAQRGRDVTLLDQDVAPMTRASRRNEGKIHLGLLYAADKSLASAGLQLRGGLSFHALLKRWLGPSLDRLPLSTPFHYLVARDSVLDADALAEHYALVEALYREQTGDDPSLDYLGRRPERLTRRIDADAMAKHFDRERFSAAFETHELAIDVDHLSDRVVAAIGRSERIRFLPQRRVEEIRRTEGGFRVEGPGLEGRWKLDAHQVVNATWESRFALDEAVGVQLAGGWLHRLKYRVIVKLPPELRRAPSATLVLGRYGDVVVRPDGTAYLSWYPLCMRGWSTDLRPPSSWEPACRGETDRRERAFARQVIDGIDRWYPGIGHSEPILVDAGVIVAYGRTDVDDERSGLHHRAAEGVHSVDGFHSLDTGKLTTAPLFAVEAADRIVRES